MATARLAGLPTIGYDRLSPGTGQLHWRLLRLIPVVTLAGPAQTAASSVTLARIDVIRGALSRQHRCRAAHSGH